VRLRRPAGGAARAARPAPASVCSRSHVRTSSRCWSPTRRHRRHSGRSNSGRTAQRSAHRRAERPWWAAANTRGGGASALRTLL